jgi:hypothetical protein
MVLGILTQTVTSPTFDEQMKKVMAHFSAGKVARL